MIVFDGRLHDTTTVAFDVADRGLTLADGLFETLLVVDGQVFRRAAHLDRLLGGAVALGLAIGRARLDADLDLLLSTLAAGTWVLRLTVTRGPGGRGLKPPEVPRPSVVVTPAPWSPDMVMRPVRLATSTIRRNETAPSSRWKTAAYVDAVAALAAAEAAGADDALLLNTRGHVACTTVANLFAVFGDTLATPRLDDGVLAGTTRALVLEAAPALGLRAAETSLTPDDLASADAIFLTNAVRLVSPVVELDRRPVAGDQPTIGRIIGTIGARIAAECGRDPRAG